MPPDVVGPAPAPDEPAPGDGVAGFLAVTGPPRVVLVGVHGVRDALLSQQRRRRGATSCHGQPL